MSATLTESGTIHSVVEAIEALTSEPLMKDLRPAASAQGGDETFGLWFRGHDSTAFQLTPSVLRRPRGQTNTYLDEVSLTRHFKAMNPDAADRSASDFEWLVNMQHYLAPTRLLDWTENLLVALYFAVRNPDFDTADAALWVLNARRLNYYTSATSRIALLAFPNDPDVVARSVLTRVRGRTEWRDTLERELALDRHDRENYRRDRILDAIESPRAVQLAEGSLNDAQSPAFDAAHFEVVKRGKAESVDLNDKGVWQKPEGIYTRLRMPVAVFAHRTNRRIRSQSGVFTLHGGRLAPTPQKRTHAEAIGLPISLEQLQRGRKRTSIAKWLLIPKACRAGIRKTLAQIGLSDASLFPELDYQSKHLVARWSYTAEQQQAEAAE
jgi:hypothetical protein